MEKFNALFKPIMLAFCFVVFAWLVLVTRYEYFTIDRDCIFRVNRLTSNVQFFHPDQLKWINAN